MIAEPVCDLGLRRGQRPASTGEALLDYLRPRLFDPLGIDNPTWETDPRGISIGGTGLHITTEDIARFGQLYLQKGVWQGRQLVPETWIAEATQATSDNSNTQTNPDWIVGYGYQFWRCRHGAYRGDGAFGQYCVLMPAQDTVLAITAGTPDMQAVLNLAWARLLPALGDTPLPPDTAEQPRLTSRLTSLAMRPQEGQASSLAGASLVALTKRARCQSRWSYVRAARSVVSGLMRSSAAAEKAGKSLSCCAARVSVRS